MITDILTWLFIAQLMGLAGLLPARMLLGALPDYGYAYAKTLGLLLVSYGAWMLAMLGVAPFGRVSLLVILLVVLGLGVALARKSLGQWVREYRANLGAMLGSEAIFLAALLLIVWMRGHDPTPWGTERPMDFAFFNAVQNTGIFPPNDPWLAGFSINYYYFGYVLMGAMALLSGLEPAVAYNLALALIFALAAQGIAGTMSNLMRLAQRPINRWALTLVPLLGCILVLVAGNQSGAIQVALGNERAVVLSGGELLSVATQAARGSTELVLPAPILTQDWGTIERLPREDQTQFFNWWWPSRSLWDAYAQDGGVRRYNITEFPLFSFRLGDMHPHVMALPFGLLAVAVALAGARGALWGGGLGAPTVEGQQRPPPEHHAEETAQWATAAPSTGHQDGNKRYVGGGKQSFVRIGLAGLVLGSLYAINSWDLPGYLLLYAGALALAGMRVAPPFPWLAWGRQLFAVVVAAYVLFLPFHLTFRSLVGAAEPLVDWPFIGRLTSIIAPYTAGRSGVHAFLIIFGLFFVGLLAFVYLADVTGERGSPVSPSGGKGLPHSRIPPGLLWLPLALLGIGWLVGFPLLALGGLGVLAFWRALTLAQRPAESFALLVVALGCAIIFGTELIFIRDLFGTRMNTIFKFYYQVWLLWGMLTPFALWWVVCATRGGWRRALAWGASGVSLVLLAGALVYPWLALSELGRGPWVGLQGRTPREASEAGIAAVAWLRRMVPAGSVVLEAAAVDNGDAVAAGLETPRCGGSYNGEGFGGIAAATGLPTLLGWDGHQRQWRGGDAEALAELGPRCVAADTLYRTLDVERTRELLQRYNVAYVYVGELEQYRYPTEALAKFETLGEVVFHAGEIRIYRVASDT